LEIVGQQRLRQGAVKSFGLVKVFTSIIYLVFILATQMTILQVGEPYLDSLKILVKNIEGNLEIDPETGNYIKSETDIWIKALIKPVNKQRNYPDRSGYDPSLASFEGWLIDPPTFPVPISFPFNTKGIWKNNEVAIILMPVLQKSDYVLRYTGTLIEGSISL